MELDRFLSELFYKQSIEELKVMNDAGFGNISFNDILYLNMISYVENCTASHIADTLNISRSAVTIRLNKMVKKGFVTREQSKDDGRVNIIVISHGIKKLFEEGDFLFTNAIKGVSEAFNEEEIETFCKILDYLFKIKT